MSAERFKPLAPCQESECKGSKPDVIDHSSGASAPFRPVLDVTAGTPQTQMPDKTQPPIGDEPRLFLSVLLFGDNGVQLVRETDIPIQDCFTASDRTKRSAAPAISYMSRVV